MDLGKEHWAGSDARLWMRSGREAANARRSSAQDFGRFGGERAAAETFGEDGGAQARRGRRTIELGFSEADWWAPEGKIARRSGPKAPDRPSTCMPTDGLRPISAFTN